MKKSKDFNVEKAKLALLKEKFKADYESTYQEGSKIANRLIKKAEKKLSLSEKESKLKREQRKAFLERFKGKPFSKEKFDKAASQRITAKRVLRKTSPSISLETNKAPVENIWHDKNRFFNAFIKEEI